MNEDKMLKQLCRFFQRESLAIKQINEIPFPVALFDRNGILTKANSLLILIANINESDLSLGCINVLNRITTENAGVLDAVQRVFKGEASFVRNLVSPIAMFARDDYLPECSDDFRVALFFPVGSNLEEIIQGAIVLMKQQFD